VPMVPIWRTVKVLIVVFLALGALWGGSAHAQIVGPAVVQPDASLIVNGRRLVLADIEITPAGRVCDTKILPAFCGIPAAIALRTKIVHFLSCRLRVDLPDRAAAVCRHGALYPQTGEDLGAFLIAEGWATATPAASPLYHTMQTIARSNGRGAWGVRLDQLINPPLQ